MAEINNQKEKGKNSLLIILLIIVLLFGGTMTWMFFSSRSEVSDLQKEKALQREFLQAEVDSLMASHEAVKIEYGILADSLHSKDSLITANAKEIKALLNTKWEYFKIKKKLDRLRNISQGYLRQIDSLYVANEELLAENKQIKKEYREEVEKNQSLVQKTQILTAQVDKASVLKAYKITAQAMRVKGSGKSKITDKVRRTDKIEVCFTLGENKIIPAGSKALYVRIARPDNLILVKGKNDQYSFEYNGELLQYSAMKELDYQNAEEDVCLYWYNNNGKEEIIPGKYVVTLYSDNHEIGQTSFELK